MSVLSDSTTLHFINNTNYFLEVRFNGEQNASLNVSHNSKNVITEKTKIYVMPEDRSVDIDTELDFKWVEFLMSIK